MIGTASGVGGVQLFVPFDGSARLRLRELSGLQYSGRCV